MLLVNLNISWNEMETLKPVLAGPQGRLPTWCESFISTSDALSASRGKLGSGPNY